MNENRRLTRWQIQRKSSLKLHGAEAHAFCFIRDLNLRGAQLALSVKLPLDTFQKISIALSDDVILDVEAWIVWHKIIQGLNVYGLYFTKIKDTDKEKIYKFLRNDFSDQLDRNWRGEKINEKESRMPENPDDNRVFERFKAVFPVRFLDLIANNEGAAKAINISAKGICINSNLALTQQAPVELWLDIPDNSHPLYTRGEIIWSKCTGQNDYCSGINLHKADFMGLARVLRVKSTSAKKT